MAYIGWHIVSRDVYTAGTPLDNDLYFITGENVIYRGTELYTKSLEFYTDTLPTSPAPNRIYVNSATLEGKAYVDGEWKTVIKPLADTVTADETNGVTGKAVATYVSEKIKEITGSGAVLTGATWDGTEHVLTFAKGDNTNVNITLTGLGCSLSYNSTTGALQLLDASGETIGDAVNLALEKFVQSGEYDAESQKIILYFDAEKTDKVEIPVGDLVDVYTVENTATINLTMVANKITAAVNISKAEGNALEAKEDGLYVAPTDVSGKADKDADAVEGNIAVFDKDGNPVDSGKNFDDIQSNAAIYVGASIDEAVAGNTPKQGDFCIVKKQIGTSDKYEHTAYIYNNDAWAAFDGNYSAENVYFPKDLESTYAIGNITLTNGIGSAPVAGKNLIDGWNSIFVKEKNPSITQPSVSISAPQNKAYEVGTTVTPSFTATLNPGSYEFGAKDDVAGTGITATEWEVTDTASHTLAANTGSFDALVVADDTNYKITAKATYGDGNIPVTNCKNEYAAGQIKAGSKSATSAAITGFRKTFYGTLTTKDELTSDVIRGLTGKSTSALKAGSKFTVSVPVGALRIVIAYPASIRDVNSILDVNGMRAEIKTAFTISQVDVEGANNYNAIAYKVAVMDFANPNDTANTLEVTL